VGLQRIFYKKKGSSVLTNFSNFFGHLENRYKYNMPYARKRIVRRSRRGRRGRVAKKTKRVIRQVVNRTLRSNLEVKSYMYGATEASLTTLTVGSFGNVFTGIAQGVANNERLGNKIRVLGIQIRGAYNNNSTVPVFVRHSMLRMVDRALPTSTTDFFLGLTGGTVDTADLLGTSPTVMRPFSPLFVAKSYWNKVYTLYSSASDKFVTRFSRFIKFGRGLTVQYNNTSSTVGNITPNLAFCQWACESQNDLGAGVTVESTYQIRIFYTDA